MNKTIKRIFEGFRTRKIYSNADHWNKEGQLSFSLTDEDLFLQTLLTNTCSDVFYADKNELIEDSVEIHSNMLIKNPKFCAQAIVYARTKGFMRLQPILGLVFLSTLKDKRYFKSAFQRVILTPSDLESFIDLCRSDIIRKGVGRSVKKEIINYLKNKLTEYHAIKYKNQLKDAIRVSRPASKVFEGVKKDIVEFIMKNKVTRKLEQVNAISALRDLNVKKDESKIIKLIEKGRLPYESIVGTISPSPKIWEALLYQMPMFATLRNLNVMARNKVFESSKAIDYVCEKFKHVEKSRILPFRFHTALNKLESDVPMKIRDCLRDALERSFVNLPEIKGRTCISPDVSGSMGGRPIQIAAIFSAALLKKCDDSLVLPVDTKLYENTCSRRDSMMTNAEKIMKFGGGGTELDLPIEYLLKKKIKVDNYICITDSEEWYSENRYYGRTGRGFYKALLNYKKKVNRNVKVFFVRLQPYGDSMVPKHEHGLYNIEGWSNTVLDFIATIINIDKDQKADISRIEV